MMAFKSVNLSRINLSRIKVSVIMVLVITLSFVLSSCAIKSDHVLQSTGGSQWDFDHQVQYKQTQIAENSYQLEVISGHRVKFETLSAFLLRRGYLICGNYGYKIEVLNGVQSYDHFKASPNLIMPNLSAKLDCPVK